MLDQKTGLTWKRCVEGQTGADCGTGSPDRLNWGDALSQAAASTFAGFRDWRVPNTKELDSLVEVACYEPALNDTVFPNDPSGAVWASSPLAVWSGWAWDVNFTKGAGDATWNGYTARARLVRGGP